MCNTIVNAEVVKIPPIVIKSKENSLDNPTNILLNLKKAILKNRKSNQPSKEEEAKSILDILKKSIPTPTKSKPLPKKIRKKKKIKKVPRKSIKKKIHKSKRKSKTKEARKRIKKKIIKKTTKVVTLKTKKVSQKQKPCIKKTIYKSTKPIGFVKTLGVVGKSEVYEVNNLVMDKKDKITNEGIANISTATIETDELKSLPFAKPIEVIKVTQPFEASEEKKYLY